jgi:hypothetical protein
MVALAACGGSTNPSPLGRTVLLDGATFVVRAASIGTTAIESAPAGHVDVTVNWSGRFNVIDVYVTTAGCAAFRDVSDGLCAVLARAEGAARPKALGFASEAGGSYTVWMANRGPTAETVVLDASVDTGS